MKTHWLKLLVIFFIHSISCSVACKSPLNITVASIRFLTDIARNRAYSLLNWLEYKKSIMKKGKFLALELVIPKLKSKRKTSIVKHEMVKDTVYTFQDYSLDIGFVLVPYDYMHDICAGLISGSFMTGLGWIIDILVRINWCEAKGEVFENYFKPKLLGIPEFRDNYPKSIEEFMVTKLFYDSELFKKAIKMTALQIQMPKFVKGCFVHLLNKASLENATPSKRTTHCVEIILSKLLLEHKRISDNYPVPKYSFNEFKKRYYAQTAWILEKSGRVFLANNNSSKFSVLRCIINMYMLTFSSQKMWLDCNGLIAIHIFEILSSDNSIVVDSKVVEELVSLFMKMHQDQWT